MTDRREVIMTVCEYEERFRSPKPSLHQTLAAARGPNRERSGARRFWVAAALVGVMATTCRIASHQTFHSATGSGSEVRKSDPR